MGIQILATEEDYLDAGGGFRGFPRHRVVGIEAEFGRDVMLDTSGDGGVDNIELGARAGWCYCADHGMDVSRSGRELVHRIL